MTAAKRPVTKTLPPLRPPTASAAAMSSLRLSGGKWLPENVSSTAPSAISQCSPMKRIASASSAASSVPQPRSCESDGGGEDPRTTAQAGTKTARAVVARRRAHRGARAAHAIR